MDRRNSPSQFLSMLQIVSLSYAKRLLNAETPSFKCKILVIKYK